MFGFAQGYVRREQARRRAAGLVAGASSARWLASSRVEGGVPGYWAAVARGLERDLAVFLRQHPELLAFGEPVE